MNVEKLKELFTQRHVVIVLFIIIVSIILLKIKSKVINNAIKKVEKTRNSKKKVTYLKLINSIINYAVMIIAFLVVMQLFGVNVSSIIAGVGIASVIAGLAVQDALKDIIMGTNIIIDNYFSVGDIVKIGDFEGKVVELGMKATRLKDINTENVLVIANRNISQALKLSEQLIIDIPIPYEEKKQDVENIIDAIVLDISKNENVKDIKYLGINEFADSAIMYRIMIWCSPELKLSIKRFSLGIIKETLDENNIAIPYMQVDIHNKI